MKKKNFIIIGALLLAICLFKTDVKAETEIKYGDVNGDGVVNEADASLIDEYLEDTIELNYKSQVRGDVDKDNKITRNDSKMIRKNIEGKIDLPVKMGDINEDGEITVEDMTMIQRWISEMQDLTEKQIIVADVTVDDEVNIADVTAIRRCIGTGLSLPDINGKPIVKGDDDDDDENDQIEKDETPKAEEKSEKISEVEKNPETGSKLYLYVISFLLVSGTALTVTYKYQKNNK